MYSLTRQRALGFTLAELLSALAILGIIATFTIPKVINASQNKQWNSQAKEMAGMISEAYSMYKTSNTVDASTSFGDLTPYLNYVAIDSTKLIDYAQSLTSLDCSTPANLCLNLHGGGTILAIPTSTFGGTANNNMLWFYYDPDGVYSGSTIGPGKSVFIAVYFNGMIRSRGTLIPSSQCSSGCGGGLGPAPSYEPTWFSWE